MTDLNSRRHGLEPFLRELPAAADAGVSVKILSNTACINVRGDARDSKFVDATEAITGQVLPVSPNTVSIGKYSLYWLGPDEWLIVTAAQVTPGFPERLTEALSDKHASVTDVSGGHIAMRVSGPAVRDVLSKGCTLDFHPGVFRTGMCAQSGLAKTNILVGLVDEQSRFDIVVRRSFSEYLALWLRHSAAEYGVNFSIEDYS